MFSFFPFTTDELIRQITINCAERGLLLLRVRDEVSLCIIVSPKMHAVCFNCIFLWDFHLNILLVDFINRRA